MAGFDKVVVTNMRALSSKYAGKVTGIRQALDDLLLADEQRGLATCVVALDAPGKMAALKKVRAVSRADSVVQAKIAIDAVCAALRPDYLMILGGVDIVPHQQLDNLLFSSDDTNETVDSDLPYACDAPYSRRLSDFIGPTRVVGRLPDVTNYANPGYLERLLRAAASEESQPAPGGRFCLGISAKALGESTRLSLASLFEYPPPTHLSPDDGPYWGRLLASPVHFINCHGGPRDCRFYGDAGDAGREDDCYPVAHDSSCVANRLTTGTVAAVECCYGAQLYDPVEAGGVVGICNTYLASGAYAFFGSSTAAYGGIDSNSYADLLCQYFLKHVLEGASVGEATLLARQAFVREMTDTGDPADPVGLKTLAQFSLMGDPSRHPFDCPTAETPDEGPHAIRLDEARTGRRASATASGEELRRSTTVADDPVEIPDAKAAIKRILRLAGVTGWGRPELKSFVVPASQSSDGETVAPASPTFIHVLTRRVKRRPAPFPITELIVAKEVDGQTVWHRLVSSR